MEYIRYAIQLKNGDYMKQEWEDFNKKVRIDAAPLPFHADLLTNKNTAERVLEEILTGNTNILCLYDDNNPPVKVVEVKMVVEVSN